MSDPDEVYELPVEDMYEVPGSRLRELADKAAFLEAALAEEREKNERLRWAHDALELAAERPCADPIKANYQGDPAGASWDWEDCQRCGSCIARAALASTGSEER
jgi:hypothetical protein